MKQSVLVSRLGSSGCLDEEGDERGERTVLAYAYTHTYTRESFTQSIHCCFAKSGHTIGTPSNSRHFLMCSGACTHVNLPFLCALHLPQANGVFSSETRYNEKKILVGAA